MHGKSGKILAFSRDVGRHKNMHPEFLGLQCVMSDCNLYQHNSPMSLNKFPHLDR